MQTLCDESEQHGSLDLLDLISPLYRLKNYNITQLMAFITTRLEAYYCRRLIDAAKNRIKLKSKGDTRRTNNV